MLLQSVDFGNVWRWYAKRTGKTSLRKLIFIGIKFRFRLEYKLLLIFFWW